MIGINLVCVFLDCGLFGDWGVNIGFFFFWFIVKSWICWNGIDKGIFLIVIFFLLVFMELMVIIDFLWLINEYESFFVVKDMGGIKIRGDFEIVVDFFCLGIVNGFFFVLVVMLEKLVIL